MATGDTPPRIPSRVHANEARRDPLRPATDSKILARPRQPGSSITKEHGREPGQDAQRIRPSTGVSQIEHGEVTSVEVIARFVEALGGRLDLVADFGDRTVTLPVRDT